MESEQVLKVQGVSIENKGALKNKKETKIKFNTIILSIIIISINIIVIGINSFSERKQSSPSSALYLGQRERERQYSERCC